MAESSPTISTVPTAVAKPWGLVAFVAGAAVAVGAVIATVGLVSEPHPDAILQPSGIEADEELISLMEREGLETGLVNSPGFGSEMVIDLSTLRGFGTYQDMELWSAVNAFESPCLIAVHRTSVDVVARQCVPVGVDLFIDTDEHGLANGEKLRFFLRGDTVVAYHLVPEED